MKCASLGGAGWCLNWTQIPFSMASFFFWSFSFTYFRRLSRLLECLICSIDTLILLARILPLFVYNDASRMLGNTVDSPGFAMVTCGVLFEQYPFPWYLQYHPSCIRVYVAKGTAPCFLKGLESVQPLLFPFVLVILANYWKIAVPAEKLQALSLWRVCWHSILRYLEINKTQINTDPYKSYSNTIFINTAHTHWRHNKSKK